MKKKKAKKEIPIIYGWVCPQCGRTLSPFTSSCLCNAKKQLRVKEM